MKTIGCLFLFASLLCLPQNVNAYDITFLGTATGSGSQALSAQARFVISGDTLTVTLTNLQGAAPGVTARADSSANLISALFFDISGSPSLLDPITDSYATTGIWGSHLINDQNVVTPGQVDLLVDMKPQAGIQPRWDYVTAVTFRSNSYGYGIGGAGLNVFGSGTDGQDYLIAGPDGVGPNGFNGAVYVQDQVVAVFKGAGLDANSSISNVFFQWGTSATDGGGHGDDTGGPVPEPATIGMFGLVLIVAGRGLMRRLNA